MSSTSDPSKIFALHAGGKLEIVSTVPMACREDLSRIYTPGFTEVAKRIHSEPEDVYRWTIKRNTVAIVSDGTAVSGLGDLGPRAALPVLEGKALLFKRFAGLNAFPLCLDTTDVDEIVRVVRCLQPTFGAVMLEDIAAPRCFAVERTLQRELSIPVLHDDQHATAAVVAAGLINAASYVDKKLRGLRVVIVGAGAAGTAAARLFADLGVDDIVACDREGAIHEGRVGLTEAKQWFAKHTNRGGRRGSVRQVLGGADVLVGLSGPGTIDPGDLQEMAEGAIVFSLANPRPEILPHEAPPRVALVAPGQPAFPNQIDGGLCYPGLFKGALLCGASEINSAMILAAARQIAAIVNTDAVKSGTIVPDIFDDVAERVAEAVVRAALETGAAGVHPV